MLPARDSLSPVASAVMSYSIGNTSGTCLPRNFARATPSRLAKSTSWYLARSNHFPFRCTDTVKKCFVDRGLLGAMLPSRPHAVVPSASRSRVPASRFRRVLAGSCLTGLTRTSPPLGSSSISHTGKSPRSSIVSSRSLRLVISMPQCAFSNRAFPQMGSVGLVERFRIGFELHHIHSLLS